MTVLFLPKILKFTACGFPHAITASFPSTSTDIFAKSIARRVKGTEAILALSIRKESCMSSLTCVLVISKRVYHSMTFFEIVGVDGLPSVSMNHAQPDIDHPSL